MKLFAITLPEYIYIYIYIYIKRVVFVILQVANLEIFEIPRL